MCIVRHVHSEWHLRSVRQADVCGARPVDGVLHVPVDTRPQRPTILVPVGTVTVLMVTIIVTATIIGTERCTRCHSMVIADTCTYSQHAVRFVDDGKWMVMSAFTGFSHVAHWSWVHWEPLRTIRWRP